MAKRYDETIYDNDKFSLNWAFQYFKLKETANFSKRTEFQYQRNLPKLLLDIKNIIPLLNKMTFFEWRAV